MSRSVRFLVPAVAAAALAVAAPVAGAAPVLTPNACQGDDGQWGDLPLKLDAAASQNGRQFDVGAIQATVDLPDWLPSKLDPYVNTLGNLSGGAGTKSIKVDSWLALAGNGSTDAPKVVTASGAVKITLASTGFLTYRITAITLTLAPSAATSWHAPDAGGTVAVAQAPAGSLPTIPAGKDNAPVQPKGSLFIRGSYGSLFNLLIDCQPGGTGGDGSTLSPTFTPGDATTLVSSVFSALPVPTVPMVGSTPAPGPAPAATPAPVTTPKPAPAPTPTPVATVPQSAITTLGIVSTALKFGSAAVLVNVACPAGGPDCTGTVALTSAKKLKVGKGAAKVRKLAAGTYTVKAGTSTPVKLKLSADGKKLRKTALVATVTLTPKSGKAVAKRIRANG